MASTVKLFMPDTERTDFREMFLHHILTISLYIISYLTNFTKAGALIMFLHDWINIPMGLSKASVELKGYDTLTFISGLTIVPAYFWSRLYAFPLVIYYAFHV